MYTWWLSDTSNYHYHVKNNDFKWTTSNSLPMSLFNLADSSNLDTIYSLSLLSEWEKRYFALTVPLTKTSLSFLSFSTSHARTVLSPYPIDVTCMQETASLMSAKPKMPSSLYVNGKSKWVKRLNLMDRACLNKHLLRWTLWVGLHSLFLQHLFTTSCFW